VLTRAGAHRLPFFLMFVGERIAFPALSEVKLHPAFGLVILVNFVGSSVYLVVQGGKVGQAREKFKVELPEMYATERGPDGKLTEDAYKFNCVRASACCVSKGTDALVKIAKSCRSSAHTNRRLKRTRSSSRYRQCLASSSR